MNNTNESKISWQTIWLIAILYGLIMPASAQSTLKTDGIKRSVGTIGEYVDYLVPANISEGFITLEAFGADGGRRYKFVFGIESTIAKGGKGARMEGKFKIGNGTNEIPPGSTIRVFTGQRGLNVQSSFIEGAGGGGGSAFCYQNINTGLWHYLVIAGAGGGGYSDCCTNTEDGGQGEAGECGGEGAASGISCNGKSANDGAGGLLLPDDGSEDDYPSVDLGSPGWPGLNSLNELPTSIAPIGSDGQDNGGGWGFGGGGGSTISSPAADASGGGGGFSGGGNGDFGFIVVGSGGGGSKINSMALETEAEERGTTSNPQSGQTHYRICPVMEFSTLSYNNPCEGNSNGSISAELTTSYGTPGQYQLNRLGSAFIAFSATGEFQNLPAGDYYVTARVGLCALDSEVISLTSGSQPNPICKDVTIALDENGEAQLLPSMVDNGSTPGCGASLTLSVSPNSFDCSNLGINEVELSAFNGQLGASCLAQVTIVDDEAPSLQCPNNITVSMDPGLCGAVVSYNLSLEDNCISLLNQTTGLASGTTFPVGTTSNQFVLTDQSGNTSACSFNVIVLDNTPPTITCLGDQNESFDNACQFTVPDYTMMVTATDNCDDAPMITQSPAPGTSIFSSTSITLTATNARGYSAVCSFNLNLTDNVPLDVSCPSDIIVGTDPGSCTATVDYTATAVDNCATVGNPVRYRGKSSTVPAGNDRLLLVQVCHFGDVTGVTYNDLPMNLAIRQDANVSGTIEIWYLLLGSGSAINSTAVITGAGQPSVFRHITFDRVNQATPFGDMDQSKNTTLELDAPHLYMLYEGFMRKAGNSVTPQSGQTEIFDVGFNLGASRCWGGYKSGSGGTDILNLNGSNGAHVAMAIQPNQSTQTTYSITPGSSFPIGTTEVLFTATDPANNTSSCSFNVTVTDMEVPTALCQNQTIPLDANGNGSIAAPAIDNGSTDDCGISSMAIDVTSFTCSNVGANTVILTATDNFGNSSTCQATIMVEDNVAPVALCQNQTVQLDANGTGSITASTIDNGSNDACGISNMTLSSSNFTCSHLGANTVTLTITDNNNNSNTCQATITVIANADFGFDTPLEDVIADCSVTVTAPTIVVDCGAVIIGTTTDPLTYAEQGTYTLTWAFDDGNGNSGTQTQTVVVDDLSPPTAICKNSVIEFNGEAEIFLEMENLWDEALSHDNCGAAYFVGFSIDKVTCDQLDSTIPVTVTIEDNQGNTSNCTANVNVTGLPCGWSVDPGGMGCDPGEGTFDPGTEAYTLSTESCYDASFYRPSDPHGFLQTELCGDGQITAQVTGVIGTGWAGISMRESNDPGAPMMQLMLNGSNLTRREVRMSPSNPAFAHLFQTMGKNWLRLTRSGNLFSAYHSSDGQNWQLVFSTQIIMGNCIQVGMITMNGTSSGEVTGIFENLSINEVLPLITSIPIENGIDEQLVADFSIFPNPAHEVMNLQFDHFIGQKVLARIYNQNGQQVHQQQWEEVSNSNQQINIEGWPSGFYVVEILVNDQQVTKKLVVDNL